MLTFDDVTDLVVAQRTSAWAEIARRLAHEIKNPLTPIQLSAERLKRKYGNVIQNDREVFDKCTDTIIRQVGDVARMVDEFSSFARMPKPEMAPMRSARGAEGSRRLCSRWRRMAPMKSPCTLPDDGAADDGRSPLAVTGADQPDQERDRKRAVRRRGQGQAGRLQRPRRSLAAPRRARRRSSKSSTTARACQSRTAPACSSPTSRRKARKAPASASPSCRRSSKRTAARWRSRMRPSHPSAPRGALLRITLPAPATLAAAGNRSIYPAVRRGGKGRRRRCVLIKWCLTSAQTPTRLSVTEGATTWHLIS